MVEIMKISKILNTSDGMRVVRVVFEPIEEPKVRLKFMRGFKHKLETAYNNI